MIFSTSILHFALAHTSTPQLYGYKAKMHCTAIDCFSSKNAAAEIIFSSSSSVCVTQKYKKVNE
jgi:hypothetical protein